MFLERQYTDFESTHLQADNTGEGRVQLPAQRNDHNRVEHVVVAAVRAQASALVDSQLAVQRGQGRQTPVLSNDLVAEAAHWPQHFVGPRQPKQNR